MKRFVQTALALAVLLSTNIFAQTDSIEKVDFNALLAVQDDGKPLYIRYGAYAHYGAAAWHRAQLVAWQSCCNDNFGDTLSLFGVNARIGALIEYPLFWRVGVSLWAEYARANYALRRTQSTVTGYAGTPVGTPIEYRLDVQQSALGFMPLLTLRPTDYLVVNVGARFGVPLQTSFSSGEYLTNDTLSFLTRTGEKTSVWNASSGAIPSANPFLTSLVGGLSYEAPLNATGTLFLCPELWYERGITSLANGLKSRSQGITSESGGSWQTDILRLGVSVKASPFRTIRPEISPEMQDKIRLLRRADSLSALERERNKLQLARMDSMNRVILAKLEDLKKQGISVNLKRVVGVSADGRELENPTISVEEYRTTYALTLFSHIFFETNSSVIPTRYRKIPSAQRETFRISNLADLTPRELNYELLNIIGKRMNEPENAGSVLFLAVSGTPGEAPKTLEQRVQAVSDYFQDVWKIPAKRIIAQTVNSATSQKQSSAFKNQPHVEISASLPSICAPVQFDKRVRRASPSVLRFQAEINAGAGLKQWALEVTQFTGDEVTTLKEEKGAKTPPSIIDWDFGVNEDEIPHSSQDLTVQLTMTDINNRNADAPLVAVPVLQSSIEQQEASGKGMKRLLRYDVLGFDEFGNPLAETQEALAALRKTLPQSGAASIFIGNDTFKKQAEAVASTLGINSVRFVTSPNLLAKERDTAPTPEGKQIRGLVRVEVVY